MPSILQKVKECGGSTLLYHEEVPPWTLDALNREEFERVALPLPKYLYEGDSTRNRMRQEYHLTDYHCAPSELVRERLAAEGIDPSRIWIIPPGANPSTFYPPRTGTKPAEFRIAFVHPLNLRSGLRTLLEALSVLEREDLRLDFYGEILEETRKDCKKYRGKTEATYFGPISDRKLAQALRRSSLLVLPSFTEGFGSAIPQALACGVPCIVSDMTGAKILIRHRENGSIVPARNYQALADEIKWWSSPDRTDCKAESHPWSEGARSLLEKIQANL